ncbi:DUF4181 domain-containing protein [Fictibacillus barbaricus]|uniref:Uncharacterized membrane protein YtjA (UPF0391 family) n=1 Tax=Fictibacillus barbaricus TaxID=182136 RepID=A0ABU1TWB4_9BACL|nr:DUF4181 domain-containing protein [Fictibacillus barbaricus]MDR7071507.1 uncharacterized membrane protein YtjA (UPF0391 family) [Fictibacillus barbaricus]
MNILALLLFAIVFGGIEMIAEKKFRKKFNIPKKYGFWYRSVNGFHRWGEILIIFIFVIVGGIMGYGNMKEGANWISKYWFFIFIIILSAFRILMEWKYDRESKEYIVQFFSFIGFTAIFLPILILFFNHKW